jgi:hypothetical protein
MQTEPSGEYVAALSPLHIQGLRVVLECGFDTFCLARLVLKRSSECWFGKPARLEGQGCYDTSSKAMTDTSSKRLCAAFRTKAHVVATVCRCINALQAAPISSIRTLRFRRAERKRAVCLQMYLSLHVRTEEAWCFAFPMACRRFLSSRREGMSSIRHSY